MTLALNLLQQLSGNNFYIMNYKTKIIVIFLILSISFGYRQDDLTPEKFIIHKVKKGDNIYKLTKEYNISEAQIKDYNPKIIKRGLRKRV